VNRNIFFAILFLVASLGFWYFVRTTITKAYIVTMLVVGMLLLTIGLGLYFTNKSRIKAFEIAYNDNPSFF